MDKKIFKIFTLLFFVYLDQCVWFIYDNLVPLWRLSLCLRLSNHDTKINRISVSEPYYYTCQSDKINILKIAMWFRKRAIHQYLQSFCHLVTKDFVQGWKYYTAPKIKECNVSGYRCVSDCRSRGRGLDPGPVPYFRGDWSWNNFYGQTPPSADLFKKGCCQLQAKVCAQITG